MRCNIGIYNLHMQAMGGGEKLTLVLAEHLSLAHNVRLFCAEPLEISSLQEFFGVDLSRVTVCPLKSPGPFWRLVAKVLGSYPTVSIHHYRQLRKLNLDIFINNSYASRLKCPASHGILMCMFPHFLSKNALDSYSTIVAISRYSAKWVRQMWNRHAEIIYPPCDDMGVPASKRKVILNVGRFIAEGNDDSRHHKMQRSLLEAFRTMTDLHSEGWELHFAGSVAPDNDSVRFAASLREHRGDLPVFFHFNATRQELNDLYRSAAVYWHGTGFGVNANKYPATQEHFGITTVEAMSAAAVPIVYSSGGQKEIVTDGVDGLWWETIDGLVNHTRRLVNDVTLREKLGQQAVLSSKRFGKGAFAMKVDRLLEQLLTKPTATA